MINESHKQHILQNKIYSYCPECGADRERSFLPRKWIGYQYVHEYLTWARAGFANRGVRTDWASDRLTADQFRKEFLKALHNRIYLRTEPLKGRKFASSYLERLRQWRFPGAKVDATYLRQFSRKGASAL